jgi:single-strand DNA-binding protein
MRGIVFRRLKQRSHETREGEKRTVFEVDEVGPSLRNAPAKVVKAASGASGGSRAASDATDDPWATPAPACGFSDEPPC